MSLTPEQIDTLAAGGDVDFDLPTNPAATSPDGVYFSNVRFQTEDGDQDTTAQGEQSLVVTNDLNGNLGADVSFVARNADVTIGDDFGTFRSDGAVYAISGPDATFNMPGQMGTTAGFRWVSSNDVATSATVFIDDGAQVVIDSPDVDSRGKIDLGVNWGAYDNGDGTNTLSGSSVDATLIVEGAGTSVTVDHSAGGSRGELVIARVDNPEDGIEETITDRSAEALMIVRDGAEVNIHQFVGIGDANEVEGATANGALIVEGAGTRMTVGDADRNVDDGFMRIAAEGATGTFILRDGAEFNLLAGSQFGGGLQLSGGSTQSGGDATAVITGADTRLFVEEGNITVGRNGGTADFTVSDQATVETQSFNVGQNSTGEALITGPGTNVSISNGTQGSLEVGFIREGSTPETLSADGTVTISDGANVSIRSFVNVGDVNSVEGGSATGTLIVEGQGTRVEVGSEDRTGNNGFMRIAEEGGTGTFILRDGAVFQMYAGDQFGGGIHLSGKSDRAGGEATAIISGQGTQLIADQDSIEVGRNTGNASFTASDGASVEALFFTSGNRGNGDTVFEGEGTTLTLAGEQLTPEFGAFLTVGRNATGTFTLRDGADVNIVGAGDSSTFPGLQAGREDGGVGIITVTGAGSTLTVDGSAITDQGNGETGFMRAGRDAGSDGTINVLDGGVITNDPTGVLFVAQNDGSTGTVNVDGAGSVFDFGARASIAEDAPGARGNGIVTVSNGGLLRGQEVINNGILDITSGGQFDANLAQEGILRSSAGVETVTIDGDYSMAFSGGIVVDVASSGNSGLSHDVYAVTGDVSLDGVLSIIGPSIEDLRGLSLDVITGASISIGDNFSLRLVEFDGNGLTDIDLADGNATELAFSTTDTGLVVDFGTSNSQSGTDVGETLTGTALSDSLEGLAGDDALNGDAGNDRMTGGAGNDMIDGGDGIDTAFYSGAQTSYTLSLSASGATLEDRRADQNGTDMLTGIEFLDFDTDVLGSPFDLNTFAGAAGLSQSDFESFIELYIAYFNRAPDAIGLNFWGTAFATGTSLEEIAALFIDQDETRALYPESLTNSDFVTVVYDNVLGRVGDQAGFDFWLGVLDDPNSGIGRDQFIREVLNGARADPDPNAGQEFIDQQLADQQFLANKTDIGAYYAVHQGLSDVDNASSAMALFDGSEASVTAAVSAIDGFQQSAVDAENGEFLMPLVGVLANPFDMG